MPRGKSQRIQHWRLCQYEISILGLLALMLFNFTQGKAQSVIPQKYHEAEISFQASKWAESITGFQSLLDDTSVQVKAPAYFRISICNERLGNLPSALMNAELAYLLDSFQDEYLIHYADLLEKKYEFNKAWILRLELIRRQPRYISRYEDALQNASNRNNPEQCLLITQKWEDQFGLNLGLVERNAQIFLALKDTLSAKKQYQKLIEKLDRRRDVIDAYNEFEKRIHPINKENTGVCPEAKEKLLIGEDSLAYMKIKECTENNPENIELLEFQFLIAFIINDLSEMEVCIEKFYTYFPFLENHAQYAEDVKNFFLQSKSQTNQTTFSHSVPPSKNWQFIQFKILWQMGKEDLARKELEILMKENSEGSIIPTFQIQKLLKQIPTR